MDLPKGWYHTPPVAKCLKVVTTHYLHTPLVVKLQRPVAVCTGYSHKPVVDKVLRDVRKYTIPVKGECLLDKPTTLQGLSVTFGSIWCPNK